MMGDADPASALIGRDGMSALFLNAPRALLTGKRRPIGDGLASEHDAHAPPMTSNPSWGVQSAP